MAKFAIAVCILMAACSGTQAGLFSDIIESHLAMGQKFLTALEEGEKRISIIAEAMKEEAKNAIQAMIDADRKTIADISATVEDVKLCASASIDEDLKEIPANLTTCVDEQLISLKTAANTFNGHIRDLLNGLEADKVEAEKCMSNWLTSLVCLAPIRIRVTAKMATSGAILFADASNILAEIESFGTSVTNACKDILTSTIETYIITGQKGVAEFKQCLENLGSNTAATVSE